MFGVLLYIELSFTMTPVIYFHEMEMVEMSRYIHFVLFVVRLLFAYEKPSPFTQQCLPPELLLEEQPLR